MKSFSQFLQESYLSEEEARQGSLMTRSGKPQDFRNPKKVPFTATDPTPTPASRRLPAAAPDAPKTPSGQLEIPEPKTTKVSGTSVRSAGEVRQPSLLTKSGGAQDFTKAGKGRVPFTSSEPVKATKRLSAGAPEAPKASSGQMDIDFNAKPNKGGALVKTSSSTPATKAGKLATTSSTKPATNPPIQAVNVKDITKKPKALPAAKSSVGKPPAGVKPSGVKGLRGVGGKALGVAGAGLEGGIEYKSQRDRGRTRAGALGGASSAVGGGLTGAKAGALTGAKLGSVLGPKGAAAGAVIGGIGGYVAGSELGKKGFETVAGATKKEKAAMAQANRQRQAGTAVKGIGGKTTFSQTKPGGPAFMSTGSGSQRKTVQLAKTGVVQRGGQSVAGNLAFKGGKAVYKAGPSAQSLAKTSSNPLERIGRTMFAGAYKKSDAANAAKKLATARQSDAARNKALGVKAKPAG
jgi:hypothetical protein